MKLIPKWCVTVFGIFILFFTPGCAKNQNKIQFYSPSSLHTEVTTSTSEHLNTGPTLSVSSTMSANPTISPSPSPISTAITKTPTETKTPGYSLTPTNSTPTDASRSCVNIICIFDGNFVFDLPISTAYRNTIDPSYRFGSTQQGNREFHHGVEFVNSQGTPILAAREGIVITAGNDQSINYADWLNFYGNLIIIQHDLPGRALPVFTLYAHMYEIKTAVGQIVKSGDVIGTIGYSGSATGSHLHFEVRVDENNYTHTANPELWLRNQDDLTGETYGGIAGKIVDEYGDPIPVPNLVIEYLTSSDDIVLTRYYIETYTNPLGSLVSERSENFAIGNLPPGRYRISFVARGLQNLIVEVLPGKLTFYNFMAGQ